MTTPEKPASLTEEQIRIIREARRIDRIVEETIATGLATEQDQRDLNGWANLAQFLLPILPEYAQAAKDRLTALSDEIKQSGSPEPVEIFTPNPEE